MKLDSTRPGLYIENVNHRRLWFFLCWFSWFNLHGFDDLLLLWGRELGLKEEGRTLVALKNMYAKQGAIAASYTLEDRP